MDMWTELTKQSSNEAFRRATVEAYHECNNHYGAFVRKSPGTRLAYVKDEVKEIVKRVAATHGVDPDRVYQIIMRRLADTAVTKPKRVDPEKPMDGEQDNPTPDDVLADAKTDVNQLEAVLVDSDGFPESPNHAEERVDLNDDTQKD